MKFDQRTARNLEEVHPDLVHLLRTFDSPWPIVVTEGARSLKKQKEYFETGKSQTMNSRHLKRLPRLGDRQVSHAIDFAVFPEGLDGQVSWDWSYYADVAAALKQHAKAMRIPIKWGGEWGSRDGVHIQLTWADYPIRIIGEPEAPPQFQILSAGTESPSATTPTLQPPKRPETSTTVAAAGGVSAVAIGEHVLRWLEGVDTNWAEYAVLAVLLVMAGWIVKERVARLDQEGM